MHPRSWLSLFCDACVESACLVLLVAAPLYFNTASNRIFEPDKVALARTIGLVIVGAWLVGWIESRQKPALENSLFQRLRTRIAQQPIHALALIFFLASVISTVFSILPLQSLWGGHARGHGLYTQGLYLVLFFAVSCCLKQADSRARLTWAMMTTGAVVAFYGLMQHFSLDPIMWTGEHLRATSSLGNPIFFAACIILVIPLAFWKVIEAGITLGKPGTRTWRIFWGLGMVLLFALQVALWHKGLASGLAGAAIVWAVWTMIGARLGLGGAWGSGIGCAFACLPLLVTGVVISNSRGPALGLAAGLYLSFVVFLLAKRMRKSVLALFIVGCGFVIVTVGIYAKSDSHIPYVEQLSKWRGQSVQVRLRLWEMSLEKAFSNPVRMVIGYGPETLHVLMHPDDLRELAEIEQHPVTADRAHNESYDILLSRGLIGLVIYLGLISLIFQQMLGRFGFLNLPHARKNFWCLSMGGIVFVLCVMRLADGTWRFLGWSLPAGLLCGLFLYLGLYAWKGLKITSCQDNAPDMQGMLFDVAIFGALVAHIVEVNFGIGIVATKTAFWILAGAFLAQKGKGTIEKIKVSDKSHIPVLLGLAACISLIVLRDFREISLDNGTLWMRVLPDYLILASCIFGIAILLMIGHKRPDRPATAKGKWLALVMAGCVVYAAFHTNLRGVVADVAHKQAIWNEKQGQYKSAVASLQEAIVYDTVHDEYPFSLAQAALESGKYATSGPEIEDDFQIAENALYTAQKLNPYQQDHRVNLARLYHFWAKRTADAALRKERLQKADALYTKVLVEDPDNILSLNDWARVLDIMGNNKDSRAKYTHVLKLDPENFLAHMGMGDLFRKQGDWANASKSYRLAVLSNTGSIEAHVILEHAFTRLKLETHASVQKQWIQGRLEGDAMGHLQVADIYRKLGAWKEATGHTSQAMKLSSPDQRAAIRRFQNDLVAFQGQNLGFSRMRHP